jgi:WD40 repeat protein
MWRPLGTAQSVCLVSVLVWTAGVVGIWWLIPVGPRQGWQPPAEESDRGFLSDGRTLVTLSGSKPSDLVHLWDIDTGRLRTTTISPSGGQVAGLLVSESRDLLQVFHPEAHRLSLNDATTGTEVASFPCQLTNVLSQPFRAFVRLCVLSPDGRTTAFVTSHQGQPCVEWYEVASGRLLHRLPGCLGPVRFSPDSRRLALVAGWSLVIVDVSTGQEILRLNPPVPQMKRYVDWLDPPNGAPWPQEFSGDGSLLLDGHCNVWDLATGTRRFGLQEIYQDNPTFTPDSRELVAWGASASECWLAYYDVATGQELVDRRVPLLGRWSRQMSPWNLRPCGQWLIATGVTDIRKPGAVGQKLGALGQWLGFPSWGRERRFNAYVLVETETGREVGRGEGNAWACTPDGRCLVVGSNYGAVALWDVPARKSFFLAAAVWSVALALITWRVCRTKPSSRVSMGASATPA